MFTVNSLFSGTRLGLCWVMLEERYEEFRGHVSLFSCSIINIGGILFLKQRDIKLINDPWDIE